MFVKVIFGDWFQGLTPPTQSKYFDGVNTGNQLSGLSQLPKISFLIFFSKTKNMLKEMGNDSVVYFQNFIFKPTQLLNKSAVKINQKEPLGYVMSQCLINDSYVLYNQPEI